MCFSLLTFPLSLSLSHLQSPTFYLLSLGASQYALSIFALSSSLSLLLFSPSFILCSLLKSSFVKYFLNLQLYSLSVSHSVVFHTWSLPLPCCIHSHISQDPVKKTKSMKREALYKSRKYTNPPTTHVASLLLAVRCLWMCVYVVQLVWKLIFHSCLLRSFFVFHTHFTRVVLFHRAADDEGLREDETRKR